MFKFLREFVPIFLSSLWTVVKESKIWYWLLALTLIAGSIALAAVWLVSTAWVLQEFSQRHENVWYGVGFAIGYNVILFLIGWFANVLWNAIQTARDEYQQKKRREEREKELG